MKLNSMDQKPKVSYKVHYQQVWAEWQQWFHFSSLSALFWLFSKQSLNTCRLVGVTSRSNHICVWLLLSFVKQRSSQIKSEQAKLKETDLFFIEEQKFIDLWLKQLLKYKVSDILKYILIKFYVPDYDEAVLEWFIWISKVLRKY